MRQINYLFSFCMLFLFCLTSINSNAQQERCNTMQALQNRIDSNPRYGAYYDWAHRIPKENRVGQIPCDGTNSIVVPVAFHFAPGVVTCGDSDCLLAEVQDQLDAMNVAYGDNTTASAAAVAGCPTAYQDAQGNSIVSTGTCISFCLAIPPDGNAQGLDPACDPPITVGAFTGGFGAGGNGAPGWNGILNLFITNGGCLGVADGIPGAANGDGVSTCAVAFGGTDPSSGCGLDTEATYNLGATMIHEIGHYLGLYHTFQGGCGDEPNGPGPFNVDDTPPAANPYFGCNIGACQATGCGTTGQGIANFMDYTDDACMTMFTEDQAAVQNYWANQLFGATASQCSAPSPAELPNACENQPCEVACATVVNTPIALTEDFCGESTTVAFPNPEDNGLVLDDDSDAVYTWSTGGYLSAGGATVAAPAILTSIGCAIATETYYLNVDCATTPLVPTLDGGTLIITVYPAPPMDITTLVTVDGEGTCNEPMVTAIAGCEAYITVTADAGNPTFPVNNGDSGTASYTVTFTPDPAGPDCCFAGEDAVVIDATTNDGDLEGIGAGGASPWTSTSTNFGTVMCDVGSCGTGGGSVNYGVAPNSGAWLGWFGGVGALETGTLSGDFVIPPCPGGMATLTFAFENSACGDAADFIELQVDGVAVWTVNTDPANCDAPGTIQTITIDLSAFADGASHNLLFTSTSGNSADATNFTIDNIMLVNVGCDSGLSCDVLVTAAYNCDAIGMPYCNDPCFAEFNPTPGADDTADPALCVTAVGCADNPDGSCIQTIACDDADPCTENDMETSIIASGEVCVPCAGTPVATCTLPSVAQACDDGDPCTENDMEEVDACDATVVCVPCAGTPIAACSGATTMVACDDGDPCTSGEMQEVDACDNTTVCVPCGNGMAVTPGCGDPTATNFDMNATCIDNTTCIFSDTYCDNPCFAEFAPNPGPDDTPDATLCITALGCADVAGIDASCISTQACDDGDPCTANEEATVITATGEVCTDCGLNATPVTPGCGDPTATNFDMNATCIDNTTCIFSATYCDNPCFAEFAPNPGPDDTPDAALCVTALGCADVAGIDPSCISTQACDDGDPCTANEEATVITATGEVCTDCGLNATPVAPACGDPTADNFDPAATCIDNNLCVFVCEDGISGSVFTDDPMCPPPGSDFSGISVTIIDVVTGMPVAGSPVLTDAMGNYSLAGPFPCGQYTAALDPATLPTCYSSLGGEEGPLPFTVNGDGTTDGANFSNIVMIPTLSQWGLMILALLLMSFGAIKVAQLNTKFSSKKSIRG